MAIICRHSSEMNACSITMRQRGLPHQLRRGTCTFHPAADTIKVLAPRASKVLKFAVVALGGVGHMPAANQSEKHEARLFCVGATRRLTIGLSGAGLCAK